MSILAPPSGPAPTPALRALRLLRPLHRWVGVPLSVLVLLSSATGVLLAWKGDVALLQPPTQRGSSPDLRAWNGLGEVHAAAVAALAARLAPHQLEQLVVDRMDARPDRGVVKVRFENRWEVQVDPVTLHPLQVARRNDVWIESLHDLSLLGDLARRLSMSLLSLGLIGLTLSGLWLWYGPRWIRRHRPGTR